jgi:hypothetical protein
MELILFIIWVVGSYICYKSEYNIFKENLGKLSIIPVSIFMFMPVIILSMLIISII